MIWKICVIALVGIVVVAVVKSTSAVYSGMLQLGVVLLVVLSVIPYIRDLRYTVESIGEWGNVGTEGLAVMLKIFLMLTVGNICADLCRDNGESAIADTVELSSRLIAVSCAVPVITSVVAVATSFLEG